MKRFLGSTALGPYSNGSTTNPASTDVLADTGAIAVGPSQPNTTNLHFDVTVTVWCNVAATFSVQRRNTANSANVGDVATIRVPADMAGQYRFVFTLVSGERIRVLPSASITGTAAATINGEQCA